MNAKTPAPFVPGGYREVFRVAWPLIISMGSFTLMTFADRIFLARFSTTAIQAAVPSGIMVFCFCCGFMALASYSSVFVSQYFGAKDYPLCSVATAQGVLLALATWPILILMIPLGRWLLAVSGHAPEVLELELVYFTILMLGSGTIALGAAIAGFFTGRGDTRTTMITNVIGNGLNIVLDYAMIFGKWGFPQMGIAGAALATVIAGFVSPLILLALYFNKRFVAVFQTRSTFRYNHRMFWRIVRFGFPSGVHLALDIASFTLFVVLTGRLDPAGLAASNIALSINTLAFMPLIGLGIAASILVGQYIGRREPEHAERAAWNAWQIGMLYMLLTGITFVLFPQFYYSLFVNRETSGIPLSDLLPVGRILLLILPLWGIMDASNLIIGHALKGAGDTDFVMYYSVTMAWLLLVPGQLLIVNVLKGSIIWCWLWTAFYIAVLGLGYILRFRRDRWKSIDLMGRQPPTEPARGAAEALVVD